VNILLTGRTGQVGSELERLLSAHGTVVAKDRAALDVSSPDLIRQSVRQLRPSLIVNAAAYTAVDRAESEGDIARRINGAAPGVLAEEARRLGALLVHFSTDYVFDGSKRSPYSEDDAPNPLSVYGRTKLEGEEAVRSSGARHLIFRTAWVYGRGRNFVSTILAKAAIGEPLRVVDDQFGAPTWARDIALAAIAAVEKGLVGTFHFSAKGAVSWYEVAREVLALRGIDAQLAAIPSSAYPAAAKRPAYSVLDNAKLNAAGVASPEWRASLAKALAEA
jgi:dTDP-4-dehydrorhamnose reductase